MNFAVLGDSPALAPLLAALHDSPAQTVVAAAGLQSSASELLERFPAARVSDDAQDLFALPRETVCVVAGHDEMTQDMARRLATEGHTLLVLPEYAQGVGFVYELTLIHDDSGAPLLPAFPLRWHPLTQILITLLTQQRLGRILHLELQRELPGGTLFSRSRYQAVFFEDVDLLRWIGGPYNQVTALETGSGERLSQALVTLAGEELADCIWKCSGGTSDRWRLAVSGERGVVALAGVNQDGETSLRLELETDAVDSPDELFPALGQDASREATAARAEGFREWLRQDTALQGPPWEELTRAFETTDAISTSLRRRRTIDLHFDTTSELSQFKTYMTTAGCGVLLFTLVSLIVYLVTANLLALPPGFMHVLRILWILPLAVFLLLQLLVLVARPPSSSRES